MIMSKSLSLAIFLSIFGSIECFSQVRFGVKAGLNMSLMDGNNYFSNYVYNIEQPIDLPAYHAGVVGEIQVLKYFSIQPEIIYSTAGYRYFSTGEVRNPWNQTTDPDITEFLSFVSVPLLLKLRIGGLGLVFGPQADRLVSAKRKIFEYDKEDASRDYNMATTFSAVVGLEYTFRFGLGFHARYTHGFQPVSKITETGIYEPGTSVKNRATMAGLHFLFGKGK